MTALRQADELHFDFEIDGLSQTLRVLQFFGEEGFCRPFHFSIQAECDAKNLSPQEYVGKTAKLVLYAQGASRTFHGIVSRFEFGGVERDVAVYSIDLVAKLFLLSQNYQSRIFQDMAADEIVQAVLESGGLAGNDIQLSCTGTYEALEFKVQYRESDLDFLNRLCEHFGIFYFFEFADDATKLIVGDAPDVHPAISGNKVVSFRPIGPNMIYDDFIWDFKFSHSIYPIKHTLRDFNFTTPHVDLTQEQSGDGPHPVEWYDYPGGYPNRDVGSSLARVRSEAEECDRQNGTLLSNSPRLAPGHTFDLQYHPVDEFNASYVVCDVIHSGAQTSRDNLAGGDNPYSNEVHFISAGIPYRPARRTRRPVVEGSQTAIVTGPEGEEIFSDEYGRVKARFHWDRGDSPADRSSCWIRVSQLWAGANWGAVFLPRIGQEVVVDFLEGDPDRPIITGRVYNAANMPPYALPDNQTQSTIKSNSSLGGDGFNEIRFEDLKGEEHIYIHAQKDQQIEIEHDHSRSVGNDETQSVGRDRNREVGRNEQVSVSDNQTVSIGKNLSLSVDGNRSSTVQKDDSLSVSGNRSVSVEKDETTSIGKGRTLTVAKDQSTSVEGKNSLEIGKESVFQIGTDLQGKVGKNWVVDVGSGIVFKAEKTISFKVGSASLVLNKSGKIQIKGSDITVKGSGKITIKGSQIAQN